MSQFRAKRLDLGGFINARVVRDHTKRKVYEQYEPERYGPHGTTTIAAILWRYLGWKRLTNFLAHIDKPSATSYVTPPSPSVPVLRPSFSSPRCMPTRGPRRSRTDVWQEGLPGVFSGILELQGCVCLLLGGVWETRLPAMATSGTA